MKIAKGPYDLFCKYGSELLWLSDHRVSRPPGTNEKTDHAFGVLERLDESMEQFHNDHYCQKMKNENASIIENLKPKVTDEVFELIEKKYKK